MEKLIKERFPTNKKLWQHLDHCHESLPKGQQPIWISCWDLKSTEELLPIFKTDRHLPIFRTMNSDDIVAISRTRHPKYKKLCDEMNWSYVEACDMKGSETSVIVFLGVPSVQNLEQLISRARNRIVIVSERKWER